MIDSRFLRFAISGILAAAVNIFSRVLLSDYMSYSLSIIASFLIAMTTGYLLMRYAVFERSGRHPAGEYVRFGLVNLLALVQVWCISMVFARYVFPLLIPRIRPDTPAHIIGVLSPVITSYYLHKYFTFGKANHP
jgi:putative flippase GtrA